MILAVDVDYRGTTASVAGIAFQHWQDSEATGIYQSQVDNIADYVPGSFYKRELPCILTLLREHDLKPDVIVIDGYVYLDGKHQPGLGKHLYDALDGSTIIIGVAKKPFRDIGDDFALYRGNSNTPLYVTAEGIRQNDAYQAVQQMHGKYRNPTLLKQADRVCRRTELAD